MVLQLCIMIQKRQQWVINAPHPPAVLMALAVRRSDTDGITQCGMSRATPEATRCCHWATTCSVSPRQPPGQQQTKRQQKHVPKRLAILMAVAVHGYNTMHIAQWRRFRALLEATKRCHRASIAVNRHNRSCMCRFLQVFSWSTCIKRSLVELKAPVFNRGIPASTMT